MAITFGCEKFFHFVYGRKFEIETDHRPLISISSKASKAVATQRVVRPLSCPVFCAGITFCENVPTCPSFRVNSSKAIADMLPRLQRFFLRLLRYDYILHFVPGKQLLLADMLSRSSPGFPHSMDDFKDEVDLHAMGVDSELVSKKMLLAEATASDPGLQTVLRCLRIGEQITGAMKRISPELTEVQGIVMKGPKVVIPKAMRAEMLTRIHEVHLVINKCKERARRLVFWPGLSVEIENIVKACAACQNYAYKQPTQ